MKGKNLLQHRLPLRLRTVIFPFSIKIKPAVQDDRLFTAIQWNCYPLTDKTYGNLLYFFGL
jgi:hypothetical protein